MPCTSIYRCLSNPLAYALQPPPDKSPAERKARRSAERAAKNTSDAIDKQLRIEKMKKSRAVGVLLLGQSESGKSTILKQFQLAYTPNAFHEERLAWRPVIYLNLIRSVRRILDSLPSSSSVDTRPNQESIGSYIQGASAAMTPMSPVGPSAHIVELKSRLSPLIALEEQLIKQLAVGTDGEATQLGWPASGAPQSHSASPTGVALPPQRKDNEAAVIHRNSWEKAFNKSLNRGGRPSISDCNEWRTNPSDPAHILDRCRSDIEALWVDEEVQAVLGRKRIFLEDYSGFYLHSISRITALQYVPSDDDILKARLKTPGVVEQTFSLENVNKHSVDWKIYDLGEARSRPRAWSPFFQGMDAIVFVAPISAFDQALTEDPRVSRVEDSFRLWRSLIENHLLSHVNIVLLLNKCDLLKRKLEAGVRITEYMPLYGDRPNDYESATKYLREKFFALYRESSPNSKRDVYVHLTVLNDTQKKLSVITASVWDSIYRNDFKTINLL